MRGDAAKAARGQEKPRRITTSGRAQAKFNATESLYGAPAPNSTPHRPRHLPAAVETNPAAPVARVVPRKAKIVKIGTATLGYVHKPARVGPAWSFERQRRLDLEAVISFSYGGPVDTDDGQIYLIAALPHLLAEGIKLRDWAEKWTPRVCAEVKPAWFAVMERDFTEKPRRFKADTMAAMLRVTKAMRDELKLKTIGAIDFTREQRATARQAEKNAAKEAARRAVGIRPRGESNEATRPWEAEGVSRRTFYRNQAKAQAKAEMDGTNTGALKHSENTQLPPQQCHTASERRAWGPKAPKARPVAPHEGASAVAHS